MVKLKNVSICNPGYIVCHPNSSYITTKLHGMSARAFNNNSVMQNELLSCYLLYRRRIPGTLARQHAVVGDACRGIVCILSILLN